MINEAHSPMCNVEPVTYLSPPPALQPSMNLARKDVGKEDDERSILGLTVLPNIAGSK